MNTNILSLAHKHAYPLKGQPNDYAPLLDAIGDASIVLLGEATHGSHEFYQMRAELSQELITKKNFTTIALEADWPDVWHINRYILGDADTNSNSALQGFKRFPQWMWRNTVMVEFIGSLYRHNQKLAQDKKVSIYGLDLYSLFDSIAQVLQYLDGIDPAAAQRARERYNCFEQYRHNVQLYGYATTFDISYSCQQKVLEQLTEFRARRLELLAIDSQKKRDDFFNAERNAHIVKNAEEYYRSLFFSTPEMSWNIRDTHMMETAQAILDHHKKSQQPKMIIWAHNSHIGNAAATQMGKAGEINIGQLMKEKYGSAVVSVGFTTYAGTVSAASNWDGPVERKTVRPARADSYEAILHELGIPQFILLLHKDKALADAFLAEKLERAIGVVYKPETERVSHYFSAQLSAQFDAIIHCDTTKAVEPLEKTPEWISAEMPETYPTGI